METAKSTSVNKFVADNQSVSDEGKVLIIREGQAPKLLDAIKPNKVRLSGTISAPSEFYNKRKDLHDKNKCHVVFDINKGTIILVVDEQFKDDNYEVVGIIQENPDLAQFKINTNHLFGIKELMQLLKFNRLFFVDKEANASIVLALQNFKAKVEKTLADTTDNRGNDEKSKITKLEHDLAESFVLDMPMHKGGDSVRFKVDVCVTATNADVNVWLESRDLRELQDSCKDSLICKELETFKDIVCIEQ